ncbi:MAG: alpha-amylase family protein [Terracidiphilus sp.]|jgi:hypothetical protein
MVTPMFIIDRRRFLKTAAATVPLVRARDSFVLAQPAAPARTGSSASHQAAADVPWQKTLRRIGQTNFTEHDPAVLDVEAWADYWASAKVGAVFISITGIVAFYPSKVPFHRPAKYLNGRDFTGELHDAAKKRGLRTVARYSPDLNWGDALAAHPEWFMRDEHGLPLASVEAPELFQTCMFSTYMTDYFPAVMREVNSRYDMDAHYTNGWPSFTLPVCYCDQCRQLPPPKTPAYWDKFNERFTYLWKLYDSIAKEKKASSFYINNMGGGVHSTPSLAQFGEFCQWFQGDNQGRNRGDAPVWGAAQQGRVCNAVLDGKMATNITGAYTTGPIRWREVTKSAAEAVIWTSQTLASGMVPYYHVVGGENGLGEDLRWEKIGHDYFLWTARHDAHWVNKNTIANIGVVMGQRTQLFYEPPRDVSMQQYTDAIYSALLEGRFLFDFIHEDRLQLERIKKYAAIILSNIALLSDEQCGQLRDYVNHGGSLLATFETSMYTERNERRADFGLADVFGIHVAGPVIGRLGNANPFMARIERPHAILDGFADTHWIAGAEFRLPLKPVENPVLTVVPGYTAYPPELSYPPVPHTNEPAVVLRERGASRLAYFPGDIEPTMWLSGQADLSRLLVNSIHWVAGAATPVTIEGKGLVEIFAWETEPGFAVHVLNYTNPNAHHGWFSEFYPIGAQKVRFRLPAGRRVTRVELLRAERDIPFHAEGDLVEFTIPSVNDYEVAALYSA